jgi:hypothetical protein
MFVWMPHGPLRFRSTDINQVGRSVEAWRLSHTDRFTVPLYGYAFDAHGVPQYFVALAFGNFSVNPPEFSNWLESLFYDGVSQGVVLSYQSLLNLYAMFLYVDDPSGRAQVVVGFSLPPRDIADPADLNLYDPDRVNQFTVRVFDHSEGWQGNTTDAHVVMTAESETSDYTRDRTDLETAGASCSTAPQFIPNASQLKSGRKAGKRFQSRLTAEQRELERSRKAKGKGLGNNGVRIRSRHPKGIRGRKRRVNLTLPLNSMRTRNVKPKKWLRLMPGWFSRTRWLLCGLKFPLIGSSSSTEWIGVRGL